ncbi:Fc fragment of IgE, low affinity II, receptor for (CD23) [Chamberlinius hualienensis]
MSKMAVCILSLALLLLTAQMGNGIGGSCQTQYGNCYSKCNCVKQLTPVEYLRQNGFILLGNNYYYFSVDNKVYGDALRDCHLKGTELALPVNEAENNLLIKFIRDNYPDTTSAWYLGANDIETEGKWVSSADNKPLTYTAWPPQRPDNVKGIQHCLIYWKPSNYLWDDIECTAVGRYICQATPATVTICP